MSRSTLASTIRIEGALFSRDFLTRLGDPIPDLPHLTPQSYGLSADDKVREAISASWNALSARWDKFKAERAKLAPGDHAVALTRREWLLPVLQELGFGRVQPAPSIRLTVGDESKEYAISHGWNRTRGRLTKRIIKHVKNLASRLWVPFSCQAGVYPNSTTALGAAERQVRAFFKFSDTPAQWS